MEGGDVSAKGPATLSQVAHRSALPFQGSIGVRKRLESCGLVVGSISLYRGGGLKGWKALVTAPAAAKGPRWVFHSDATGWTIRKEPPTRT